MPLTREHVVETAVDLLDRVGIEGLTLRRLADELGVTAPTLYWHIDDKRHLLDLMVEEIYGRAEVRTRPMPGEPWWQWLAANARAQREILISIRDAALVVAGNRPTERSWPFIEQTLASFVDAGIDPASALKALRSLNDYVIGSAVEYQSMAARVGSPKRDAEAAETFRRSADYPLLLAALGDREQSLDTIFEAGLAWFVNGLRADVLDRIDTLR